MFNLMQYIIWFIIILITTLILIYYINKNAYDNNGNLKCDNYVFNTYLYILLSFVLMGLFSLIYIYTNFYNILINFIKTKGIGLLIIILILYIGLFIGCLILLNKLNPNTQGLLIHLLWIILIILLSISFVITLIIGITNNILLMTISLLILITAITGFVGYNFGNLFIPINFDKYIYSALIILIVIQIIMSLLINNIKIRYKMVYVFSIISLIIFILLMLSYNNKLRKKSKQCNINNNPPNYPVESIGLVIKMMNVFQDIIILLNGSNK